MENYEKVSACWWGSSSTKAAKYDEKLSLTVVLPVSVLFSDGVDSAAPLNYYAYLQSY